MIVVGQNDNRYLVRGWFVREFDGRNEVCYRWSGREALLRLDIPAGATTLRLMVSGASGLTREPASFSIYKSGTLISHQTGSQTDMWTMVDVSLPAQLRTNGPTELVFRSEKQLPNGTFAPRVFIPDQYLHNGDPREMGIRVAALRIL